MEELFRHNRIMKDAAASRGPPKKRKKMVEPSSENSIVPIASEPTTMYFPPRLASGSNQPEPLHIEYPLAFGQPTLSPATSKPRDKKKITQKAKAKKNDVVPPDSPSMCTRSKTPSPALGTRSKRKLL